MNTKPVMIASAVLLVAAGLSLTFLPAEIAQQVEGNTSPTSMLILQLLGALYLGFAMLNWMAKGSLMGGIYNRPIAMSNFTHFLVGGLALLKAISKQAELPPLLWMAAGVYTVFAVLFGLILFGHPAKVKPMETAISEANARAV